MQIIYSSNPITPINAVVELYKGGIKIDHGNCAGNLPWTFNNTEIGWQGNFGCDVNALIGGNGSQFDNPTPTWGIKDPGSYVVRIISGGSDKYFIIFIPEYSSMNSDSIPLPKENSGNADFNLRVDLYNNTLTFIQNGRGCSIGSAGLQSWINYTVTLKNSFNAEGNMSVDYNNVLIPATGKDYVWSNFSFPHRLAAIDQQPTGINYMQRFSSWSTDATSRAINISAGNNTYQANFKNEYNITFQNSFSGATGGVITVNGTQQNAPYNTTALQDIGINASAVDQTFNFIEYTFSQWDDGNTTKINRLFTPDNHKVYTAYFVGKPSNRYGLDNNRDIYFTGGTGHSISNLMIHWTEHPNPYVTKYQIWRQVKNKGGSVGSPDLIGTVNRGTTSFVDECYALTSSYTDDMLYYDVRAYYSIEGTYAAYYFVSVYGKQYILPKQEMGNTELGIAFNSIDNFPNPFNPSTTITYQIVNPGFVSIKVYDVIGKEIAELVKSEQSAGRYSVAFNAENLSSGIYFYRIISNDYTETKKMLLTK